MWISQDFRHGFPTIYKIIREISGGLWSLVADEGEFRRMSGGRRSAASTLGLVTADELQAGPAGLPHTGCNQAWLLGLSAGCLGRFCHLQAWAGTRHVYTIEGLVQFIQKVDKTRTVTGAAIAAAE